MLRLITFFSFLLSLVSTELHAQSAKKIDYAKEGYVKARVIKYDVDGCGFLIELGNKEKTKLLPDKLADEFKRNNRKIWLKYSPAKKSLPGTCMAGKQIEIIDIKKR